MKNLYFVLTTFLLLSLSALQTSAQIDLQCNGRDQHSLYLVNSNGFYRIDSVDTSPTDPIFLDVNPFANVNLADGISINNNLDSAAGPQTMYHTNNNGPYHFWNGTGWSSSVNSSGSFYAVNPGGGTNYIYNIDGLGGTVYRYDGTGIGTALVSNLGSSLNIVYDIAVDNQENFYLFYTGSNKIVEYNSSGVLIDSFTTSGFTALDECGFAILGNRIYATSCNNNYGLYEGIKTGSNINFTMVKSLTDFFIDIAACPQAGNPLAVFANPQHPHFTVYPNPVHDKAMIKLHNTESLTITDYVGALKCIISTHGLTEYTLDAGKWQPGVYLIKATSENKLTTTATLIVQ